MLSYSRVFSAVLLLGVSIALALSLIPIEASVGNGIYSTVVGEQKLITLVDASQVHLDTHSQIRVAYEEDVRKIYLLHGKAHFSVAENPDRPFEVYASSGLVRAVGTAFSVYLVDSDIEVIVNEGRVELARFVPGSGVDILPVDDDQRSTNGLSQPVAKELPGKGTLRKGTLRDDATANELIPDNRSSSGKVFMSLGQGQGVKFSQTQQALIQLSDRDLSNKLAWRKGALVFVRVPLVDIVAEIGRYTNVKVEIVDPALRDLVMGGRFRVGELDALFDVLDIGFGVQVSYLNENHVQLHFATDG